MTQAWRIKAYYFMGFGIMVRIRREDAVCESTPWFQ